MERQAVITDKLVAGLPKLNPANGGL